MVYEPLVSPDFVVCGWCKLTSDHDPTPVGVVLIGPQVCKWVKINIFKLLAYKLIFVNLFSQQHTHNSGQKKKKKKKKKKSLYVSFLLRQARQKWLHKTLTNCNDDRNSLLTWKISLSSTTVLKGTGSSLSFRKCSFSNLSMTTAPYSWMSKKPNFSWNWQIQK